MNRRHRRQTLFSFFCWIRRPLMSHVEHQRINTAGENHLNPHQLKCFIYLFFVLMTLNNQFHIGISSGINSKHKSANFLFWLLGFLDFLTRKLLFRLAACSHVGGGGLVWSVLTFLPGPDLHWKLMMCAPPWVSCSPNSITEGIELPEGCWS